MKFSFPLILIMLILATGCSSKVKPTGFLEDDYDSFNAIDNNNYKLRLDPSASDSDGGGIHLTVDEDTSTTEPLLFIVAPPEWTAPSAYPEEPEREEKILFTIRERMYRYILRAYPHPTRVRYAMRHDDPLVNDHQVIVITSHVTDYKLGIGWVRFVIGWFGMARLQVEGGMYTDLDRKEKVGEYAFRVGHAGYAQNGFNPAVLKSDYCLLYAAEEGLRTFTQQLPQFIRQVPPASATEKQSFLQEMFD